MSSPQTPSVAPTSRTIAFVRAACYFLKDVDVKTLRRIAEELGIEYIDGISVAVAAKDLLCAGLAEDFKETKQQRTAAKNAQ